MKVILLEDVENVGKKYEVKDVKPGHAHNLLIPNKLARPATKESLKWLKEKQEVIEKEATEDLEKSQGIASKLDGEEVTISVKVGDSGELFESINAQKIVDQLKVMGFTVKKAQVKLSEPIKETGEFPVKIALEHNLECEITVVIVGDDNTKEKEEE